jgi:hypothetical protein
MLRALEGRAADNRPRRQLAFAPSILVDFGPIEPIATAPAVRPSGAAQRCGAKPSKRAARARPLGRRPACDASPKLPETYFVSNLLLALVNFV